MAGLCLSKAVYAHRALAAAGFTARFTRPFFREFVVELPMDAGTLVERLAEHRIIPGIPLGRFYEDEPNSLLIAFTEKRTRQDIDRLVEAMSNAVGAGEAGS